MALINDITINEHSSIRIADRFCIYVDPFMIRQTDCTWFTEYTREEGFSVRGFWRLQACGPNYSEHKLIYINSFEKQGYHRRARKEVHAA